MADFTPAAVAAGVIAGVVWGSYLVPLQRATVDHRAQIDAMGFGCLLLVLPLLLITQWSPDPRSLLLLLASGVIWGIGNITSIEAARAIGLARAVPIFVISVLVNTVWGALLFGEAPGGSALVATLAGVGLCLAGVAVVAVARAPGTETAPARRRGIGLAVLTAILFGTYNAVAHAATAGPLEATAGLVLGAAIASIACGIALRGAVFLRSADGRFFAAPGVVAGFLWAVGTLASLVTIAQVGLIRSFPLFMINVPIYTVWGVLYFKEARGRTAQLVGGMALLVAGAFLVVTGGGT